MGENTKDTWKRNGNAIIKKEQILSREKREISTEMLDLETLQEIVVQDQDTDLIFNDAPGEDVAKRAHHCLSQDTEGNPGNLARYPEAESEESRGLDI